MTRRVSGFSLPSVVAERLEGALRGFGNREAAARLALLLARAHRRIGRPFAVCRRALAHVASLDLSEAQIRRALAVLERVGFLGRIGGGGFDRERQQNRPVIWRLSAWAARTCPKWPLQGRERRSGPDDAPKPPSAVQRPQRGLYGAFQAIPIGGELAAMRMAARAALDRLRGAPPLPGLSTAALTAGRWGDAD